MCDIIQLMCDLKSYLFVLKQIKYITDLFRRVILKHIQAGAELGQAQLKLGLDFT